MELDLSSPRTLEAMLESGILAEELSERSFAAPGLSKQMVKRKEEWFEQRKKEAIMLIRQKRATLKVPTRSESAPQLETCLSSETKRLEAAKRRQQREFERMVKNEQKMSQVQARLLKDEQDAKLRAVEHQALLKAARAEADKKERERTERAKQRVEEEAREAQQLEEKERQREAKRKKDEDEARKQFELLIVKRERERSRKLEERHKRTEEAMLRVQATAEAAVRKVREREERHKEQMDQAKEAQRLSLLARQAKAKERIARALEHHRLRRVAERDAFQQRQRDADERARLKEEELQVKLKKHQDEQVAKDKSRHERLEQAVTARQERRARIVEDRVRREKQLNDINKTRDLNLKMHKLEADLDREARINNVARQRRADEYHRLKLLSKLQDDYDRSCRVKDARNKMIQERKAVAHAAFLRKCKLKDAVDAMRITNRVADLGSI